MDKLTEALLGGVAISALAVAPAVVQQKHPGFHFTALHGGRVVNKTKMPNHGATHITYTFGIYSYQPANAPPKTHLIGTFYRFESYNFCALVKEKIKAPKKSIYARLGTATETYSFGCSNGPTTFLGDTWTNKTGKSGDTDFFVSKLISTFKNNGTKYKATMNLDVGVIIE